MKRIVNTIVTAVTTLGVMLPLPATWQAVAAAAPASTRLYVSQLPATAAAGSTLRVAIRVAPVANGVDTLDLHLGFPADKLSFQSLDKSGSAFNTFVPSEPKASGNSVEVAASHLGSAVSDDSLVATALFTVKATSGQGQVSLDGSHAARNGSATAVTAEGGTVTFTAAGSTESKLALSDIRTTDVTVSGATVRWHTAVPATSSVDYGATNKYGNSAGTGELVTDHVVSLMPVFGAGTTVHFKVASVDADGNAATSADQRFNTLGYTVRITVKDAKGGNVNGADVKVENGPSGKTDQNGRVQLSNVKPGNQKVAINGGQAQLIAVRATDAKDASKVQEFTLTAAKSDSLGVLAIVLGLLALALLGALWFAKARRKAQSK